MKQLSLLFIGIPEEKDVQTKNCCNKCVNAVVNTVPIEMMDVESTPRN